MKASLREPWIWLLVLVLLVLVPVPGVLAQDEDDDEDEETASSPRSRQSFTLGLRSWLAQWNELEDTAFEFDSAFMLGPTISYRIDEWTLGATYLAGTFDGSALVFDGQDLFEVDTSVQRSDLDVYLAYRLRRAVNLTAGFKRIDYTMDIAGFGGDIEVGINSLAAGASVAQGIGRRFFVGGSANVLYILSDENNFDEFGGATDLGYDGNVGFNLEANVGYRVGAGLPIPIIGYRVQTIPGDADDDKFSGLTLSLVYSL